MDDLKYGNIVCTMADDRPVKAKAYILYMNMVNMDKVGLISFPRPQGIIAMLI